MPDMKGNTDGFFSRKNGKDDVTGPEKEAYANSRRNEYAVMKITLYLKEVTHFIQ